MSSREKKLSLPEDSYLPEELLTEILARLPSKTLLKFRSVCKTWCSLIDSSDFIKLYNNTSKTHYFIANGNVVHKGCIFTVRHIDTLMNIKIANNVRLPDSYSISGSCNGLILLRNRSSSNEVLWNLVLGGFSPSSNDYKVLAIDKFRFHEVPIAVYSLVDRLWRVKPNQANNSDWGLSSGFEYCEDDQFVSCRGVVYWIESNFYYKAGVSQKLYLFNFDVEEFSVMQLPDAVKDSIVRFIFKHGESLAVFSMSSERSCIWVLEKDGGEDPWRLWFSGDPNSRVSKLFERSPVKTVYVQHSNTFLFKTSHAIMSYSIASNHARTLGKKSMGCHSSLATYVESLAKNHQ
ncbi:F-box/kelch-repeat protein At3g23880-like [Chenopodium quinoa]|uniref:F-box/kelch-repeat protein At3g23880-like n=1 Tax=Chenopodium quinoa TaxID=63459 RepID=UPI000B76C026|nr:F-box/kelch-repeat protein At3g23880-like [Chenopodium quinoa]